MTTIKNLHRIRHLYGKSAPKLLAIGVLAAILGTGGYLMFGGGSGKNPDDASIVDEITTPEDAAAALYNSVLSENYIHNVRLVSKLRNLDFEKHNELPASAMTAAPSTTPPAPGGTTPAAAPTTPGPTPTPWVLA